VTRLRAALALLFLALGTAIGFVSGVERGVIGERVRARAQAVLGRSVTVAGGAEVVLWPRPEVTLRSLAVAPAPGRARPAVISARRVVVELAVLPLLWGETRFERVRIEEPRVIADLDLAALAAWRLAPRAAAIPEIEVSDGSGRLAVRIGDGSVVVELDRLEVWMREPEEIVVVADGRIGDWPPFAIEGTFSPGDAGLLLTVRSLRLGDGAFAGTVLVELRGDRPRILVDLRAPTIAIEGGLGLLADRWRDLAGRDVEAPLSLRALAEVDLALELAAERVTVNGAELTAARLSLNLDSGRLELAEARASHADGTISLSALVDRGERAFALDIAAERVPLGVLGLDSARADEPGHASIHARLRARGLSLRHILTSLEGSVRTALAGARVPGLDFETVNIVLPWLREAKAITVERLIVDLDAEGGVVTAREVVVETPRVALSIDGVVDFNEETLHLEIAPTVKDPRIADQTVPLIITGPLAAPAVLPNPAGTPASETEP
jgi:uncharacterized protein involved in outer membrane biogenesis